MLCQGDHVVSKSIQKLFADASCDGWLCVLDIDGTAEVHVGGDDLVVAASVFKVAIAVEVFRQADAGHFDLQDRVRIRPNARTVGPTGFSTFADEVDASIRDLTRMMLVVSDNAATDILIDRVGLDRVRATLTELGLKVTAIPFSLQGMLDSIGQDARFTDWAELTHATATARSADESQELQERLWSSRAMQPEHAIRTTAREMARLLRLIWRDEAGPAEACAQVRHLMAQQVTKNRLAMGFQRDVRVAAKSGSLFGVIRNEIGVLERTDGRRYAAAVFTRAHRPWINENEINTVIGTAAALAIDQINRKAPGAEAP